MTVEFSMLAIIAVFTDLIAESKNILLKYCRIYDTRLLSLQSVLSSVFPRTFVWKSKYMLLIPDNKKFCNFYFNSNSGSEIKKGFY